MEEYPNYYYKSQVIPYDCELLHRYSSRSSSTLYTVFYDTNAPSPLDIS